MWETDCDRAYSDAYIQRQNDLARVLQYTQTFLLPELSARRADRGREDCLPLTARQRGAAPG